MQRAVDRFNLSQDRIVVEYLSTSNVDRKTIVAAAGGDPPDIAGLWIPNLYAFSDANALLPLDDFLKRDGIDPSTWLDRYYPLYAEMCEHRGKIWGVPSAVTTTALHWNKTMFSEAGLNPEQPPRTVQELDEFAEKLTKWDASGRITQIGFLPQEPGWWAWSFPLWFGGSLVKDNEVSIGTDPRSQEAFEWVASYSERYGVDAIQSFTSGFGSFGSPQTAFFSGKVAMVFQGVWLNNFINDFAPGLDYGVAPWPSAVPGTEDFTVADGDVLAIPRGAKHPDEAWEFIKWMASSNPNAQSAEELDGIEIVAYHQQKNSPMRAWSPFFETNHPHPHIELFRRLSQSPNAQTVPNIGTWQSYGRELTNAFDHVRLLASTPAEALAFCQRRAGTDYARHQASMERREKEGAQ